MALEVLIGLACALLGAILGILGFNRTRDNDVKKQAKEAATLEVKLDMVGVGVDAIRMDLKESRLEQALTNEKVIRIEESVKQAHKRIDALSE